MDREFLCELDEFAQSIRNESRTVLSFWERHSFYSYENVCSYALYLSVIIGRRLPDNIHSRLVLGNVNQYVKQYIS